MTKLVNKYSQRYWKFWSPRRIILFNPTLSCTWFSYLIVPLGEGAEIFRITLLLGAFIWFVWNCWWWKTFAEFDPITEGGSAARPQSTVSKFAFPAATSNSSCGFCVGISVDPKASKNNWISVLGKRNMHLKRDTKLISPLNHFKNHTVTCFEEASAGPLFSTKLHRSIFHFFRYKPHTNHPPFYMWAPNEICSRNYCDPN